MAGDAMCVAGWCATGRYDLCAVAMTALFFEGREFMCAASARVGAYTVHCKRQCRVEYLTLMVLAPGESWTELLRRVGKAVASLYCTVYSTVDIMLQ